MWECESSTTLLYTKNKYPNFFVGSDWWAANPVDRNRALSRGLDQELPSANAFNDGTLSQHMDEVNASVMRVLRAMNEVGLLNRRNWSDSWASKHGGRDTDAYEQSQNRGAAPGSGRQFTPEQLAEAAAGARRVVRESTVLLRNANNVLPLAENSSEKIGLFGCHPSYIDNSPPGGKGIDWWSGFFITGGGSGAVTWHESDIGAQIKLLDDPALGIPSALNKDGRVFNVAPGTHPTECDVAIVCYSAYAAEEYIHPNSKDRTTLRLHTMYGTSDYKNAFSGMPSEAVSCKKKIAVVSTPGSFSNALVPGDKPQDGMGDFDAILAGVYPGEQFGPGLTDLLFARNNTNFSAKLSFSLPQTDEDVEHFLARDGVTEYTERGAIGHRYLQQQGIMPAYGFGYGLSYTATSLMGGARLSWGIERDEAGASWWTVRNICVKAFGGNRPVMETVQIYIK